ncbi:hypothetical protein C8R44DRAFT_749330 [Mycena epipterygia]|nr:hypothetical protein C8R44DRAFT_749330 [Mycena epipterygia]
MGSRGDGFAETVLLVCASGLYWSRDPRVLPPTKRGDSHLNAGGHGPPSKHFLRQACHSFSVGCASWQSAGCIFVGIGLRRAQTCFAIREGQWTAPGRQDCYADIGHPQEKPTDLKCDNETAIILTKDEVTGELPRIGLNMSKRNLYVYISSPSARQARRRV